MSSRHASEFSRRVQLRATVIQIGARRLALGPLIAGAVVGALVVIVGLPVAVAVCLGTVVVIGHVLRVLHCDRQGVLVAAPLVLGAGTMRGPDDREDGDEL